MVLMMMAMMRVVGVDADPCDCHCAPSGVALCVVAVDGDDDGVALTHSV